MMPGNGDGPDDDDLGIEQLHRLLESALRESRSGDPLAVEVLGVVNDMVNRAMGVPESVAAGPAAVMIMARARAGRLGGAIADALAAFLLIRGRDLSRDPERALPDASAIGAALGRARDLLADLGPDFDLGLDLDHGIRLAERLTGVLARSASFNAGQAGDLSAALQSDLLAARHTAGDLVLRLARLPADASGADLSRLEIHGLGALHGVTWTHGTTWPPAIATQVRAHSVEVQPGVYTIRVPYGSELR
jgi:hypothetical protein